MNGSGRVGVAEVDVLGRGEEVGDDQAGEQLDQLARARCAARYALDERQQERRRRRG